MAQKTKRTTKDSMHFWEIRFPQQLQKWKTKDSIDFWEIRFFLEKFSTWTTKASLHFREIVFPQNVQTWATNDSIHFFVKKCKNGSRKNSIRFWEMTLSPKSPKMDKKNSIHF